MRGGLLTLNSRHGFWVACLLFARFTRVRGGAERRGESGRRFLFLFAEFFFRVPRLRWGASEVGLRDFFLVDKKKLGIACTKYRASHANEWPFQPWGNAAQLGSEVRPDQVG